MTSNHTRATTLIGALRAAVDRDLATLEGLFTDDVRAWTPTLATASLRELMDELERRDESFSAIELAVEPLDVGGDFACVEWTVAMTHTGPIRLTDETSIEPSGIRVALHGVTIAEFLDERICALRQYWDEQAILEQLGVVSRND
jgi:ketosteroid isomerase-like protein